MCLDVEVKLSQSRLALVGGHLGRLRGFGEVRLLFGEFVALLARLGQPRLRRLGGAVVGQQQHAPRDQETVLRFFQETAQGLAVHLRQRLVQLGIQSLGQLRRLGPILPRQIGGNVAAYLRRCRRHSLLVPADLRPKNIAGPAEEQQGRPDGRECTSFHVLLKQLGAL